MTDGILPTIYAEQGQPVPINFVKPTAGMDGHKAMKVIMRAAFSAKPKKGITRRDSKNRNRVSARVGRQIFGKGYIPMGKK